jgi:hypothetical protein
MSPGSLHSSVTLMTSADQAQIAGRLHSSCNAPIRQPVARALRSA